MTNSCKKKQFTDPVQPSDSDAKFADLWRTENVWGAL